MPIERKQYAQHCRWREKAISLAKNTSVNQREK